MSYQIKRTREGESKMYRTVSLPQSFRRKSKQYMKRPKGASLSMRSYIRSTINRLAEKKCVLTRAENVALFTVQGTVPNSISLAPAISQGVTQNTRVGNQVRVVAGTIRGHLSILPYNITTNPLGPPVMIKMWVVRYKPANTSGLSSTDAATGFFDTGSGVAGFQATTFDLEAYINQDSWELVTEKIIKIGASSGTSGVPSTASQAFDNSSSILPFRFDFGSKLGVCYFNDTTTTPTNKNLWLVIQPVYANGSVSTDKACVEMSWSCKIEFTDV